MKNLDPEIREKAVDILNALTEKENMSIDHAIPTAISRAKDWAANRGKSVQPSATDRKKHGKDVYVLPRDKGWAVKKEKDARASSVFSTKIEAVSVARKMAIENNSSLVIQRNNGTFQSRISYTK
jgi:uncharacterized protein YdaT